MAGPEPKLRELFSKAAECPTAEDQAAYLDRACQGNAELRAQLEIPHPARAGAKGICPNPPRAAKEKRRFRNVAPSSGRRAFHH